MSENKNSIYQKYEDATRVYYGADKDPLKFVPAVSNKNVAHDLALGVERSLGEINEADLATDALRSQRRNSMPGVRGETDLDALKNEALDDRLRRVVVNTELTHAAEAPQDFNEDSERSGAYKMANGEPLLLPPDHE